jgi:serine/threonine-protein kinase
MATVYEAEDLRHGRSVAIKVLRPELPEDLTRFTREIRLIARLQHPNILPLIDSGEEAGFPYYVAPFISGSTLRAELDRVGSLPVKAACRLAFEIADALSAAHHAGIVHRDVKPDNILLSNGHALIADFGIARALGEHRITASGVSLGTPNYMSPEQAAGELDIGPPSDQYSLACVLFETLTGDPPFQGISPAAVIGRHLTAPIPSLAERRPEVPAQVVAAVTRALAKTPALRHPSIEAFRDLL